MQISTETQREPGNLELCGGINHCTTVSPLIYSLKHYYVNFKIINKTYSLIMLSKQIMF